MTEPSVRLVHSQESLRAVSYNDTRAAQPPIPIAVATPPRPKSKGITGLRKPKFKSEQQWPPFKARSNLRDDHRRDSGLAPSSSTARDSKTTLSIEAESSRSIQNSPLLPQPSTLEDAEAPHTVNLKQWDVPPEEERDLPPVPQPPFIGLVTEIPTGSFDDLTLPGQVQFSTRGSMLIGGRKANHTNGLFRKSTIRSRKPSVHLMPPTSTAPKRVLSADEEILSNQVRSMYEDGHGGTSDIAFESWSVVSKRERDAEGSSKTFSQGPSRSNSGVEESKNGDIASNAMAQASSGTSREISLQLRDDKELAGGIEDWEDINNGDVDRYGFIVPPQPSQGSSRSPMNQEHQDLPRMQRVSTVLQIASEAPRRRRSRLVRSAPSAKSPSQLFTSVSNRRPDSRNSRPPSAQSSERGTLSGGHSKLRSATNKLPRHRDHRFLHEAGDMLTLPPGLADIAEYREDCKAAEDLRRREREREEKWRRMARNVNHDDRRGGGMVFEFDTKSPKVIERTWKGIPDRWRATAWHSFLSTSAKRRKDLPSDEELKLSFHKLLAQGSPDDVQIDIDVPRTINRHIMFRRRYRGGQRLLFRVLHCLSIYFPDTGYVQGMAALGATLLCYFDEEMTFVMLVRLWQLRGLERLYLSGFGGLMQALEEFETGWLAGGDVATKLNELDVSPTAYGTRWYLTLFNYSIPFPAQLRVWDVFMLLGDPDDEKTSALHHKTVPNGNEAAPNGEPKTSGNSSYHGSLDVLHAVSAALIDGMREILLDSDFENAMKVLTSWIPIRDEELLMRVAKVEWKMHRRRK
ncbi:MAG: hypothetical protein Q9201_002523 [Fulgogasparrea decipioides]